MKKVLKITISLLIIWSSFLYAEIRIVITKGEDKARPIGIVPFKWIGSGDVPEDISKIISNDLRNSGKLNPISEKLIPQKPNFSCEIIPNVWIKLSVDSILIGKIQSITNVNYLISYQLIDIIKNPGTVLTQNQYKINKENIRYAAHTISDEIFEKLTGIKGVFRTRIAYVVKNNKGKNFYKLNVSDYDGYNNMTIHRSSEPLMSPAWSADGKSIAYVTFEDGSSKLVIQTFRDAIIRKIIRFPQHNGAPSFSPDGKKLAFVLSKNGSLNIYVMNLSSNEIYQVTHGRSNNTEPSWFPDNNTLAYTSDQGGYPQIYKTTIHGSSQRLSWEGDQNQDANVSSDGKFLVMVSRINREQHISKLDLTTGIVKILTNTFLDETPRISPNCTMIIYSTFQRKNSVLHLISIDGRFKVSFSETEGQVKFPSWSPYM